MHGWNETLRIPQSSHRVKSQCDCHRAMTIYEMTYP